MRELIHFPTTCGQELVDITSQVQAVVERSAITDGLVARCQLRRRLASIT
jgi:thiamine phosphate synthase YjbQ (UPF0047 family)